MQDTIHVQLLLRVLISALSVCCISCKVSYVGNCPSIPETDTPSDKYVQFFLYTSVDQVIDGEILNVVNSNIENTSFNAANPTKIIIHGFLSNPDLEYLIIMRTEYLKRGNVNVIAVDYSFLARGPVVCYPTATLNTRYVGKCIGQLIQQLRLRGANDIHVIGHSLGAQTTNYVAKNVNPMLPRITGLDPAGPLYTRVTPSRYKLDASDAIFVDVIHTDSGGLGERLPCGDVDFYVNNGSKQPNCNNSEGVCSHLRAAELFTESINTDVGFYGKSCFFLTQIEVGKCGTKSPRTILMGAYARPTSRGLVNVPTNGQYPYAMGP